jgi:hypothetical protein
MAVRIRFAALIERSFCFAFYFNLRQSFSIPAIMSVAAKENKLLRNTRENGEYEYSLR